MNELVRILVILASITNSAWPKQPHQRQDRNLLLYKISDDKSVYIVDKMRKVSFDQLSERKTMTFGHPNANGENDEYQEYSLLYANDDYMLVGSLNMLYNISLSDLNRINKKINFTLGSIPSFKECLLKKSTPYYNPYKCGNYVKVAVPLLNDSIVIACTTNNYNPICTSQYIRQSAATSGVDVPPHSLLATMKRNSVPPPFVYGNSIYYFYISDKTSDGIFKQNFVVEQQSAVKFTELVNVQSPAILNPNFRSSYGHKDKVYFFFSELDTSENSDVLFKTPTSFVGEICADDNGRQSYNYGMARFLTFKKAVINCYLPDFVDKIHIKYNEIQQATKPLSVGTGPNSSEIFYAIFTLRRANSVDSALCEYKLSSVESSMRGLFKSNPDKQPVQPYGSCAAYAGMESSEIDAYYRGITKNNKYQMEQTINARATFALNSAKFTALAVDAATTAAAFGYHVIYIGLDNGRLLKVINSPSSSSGGSGPQQPVIVAEYEMFNAPALPIDNVLVTAAGHVIALSARAIRAFRVDALCELMYSCTACVESQDPYCHWTGAQCVSQKNSIVISKGDKICPKDSVSISITTSSDDDVDDGDDDDESNDDDEDDQTTSYELAPTTLENQSNTHSNVKNLVYTINDYSKYTLPKHLIAARQQAQSSQRPVSIGLILFTMLLVSVVASLSSVLLTCMFIKRHYVVRNRSKPGNLLVETTPHRRRRFNPAAAASSRLRRLNINIKPPTLTNYFNPDRLVKLLNRYYFIDAANSDKTWSDEIPKSVAVANCYEKNENLQVVTAPANAVTTASSRPNSSSEESPYTASSSNTTASSSIESNSNSPKCAGAGSGSGGCVDTSLSVSSDDIIVQSHNLHSEDAVTSSLLMKNKL